MSNLLKQHAYVFDTTGVTIVRGQISPEKVNEARNALYKIHGSVAALPWKFPVLRAGRVFWEFMTHPMVMEMSREFCGPHFRMDHAFGVAGNTSPAQLHGGPQSSQYSCFYNVLPQRNKRAICGQLNFGICLQEQTRSTGGFCYVPGSHKQSDPRAGAEILQEVYSGHFDHASIVVPDLRPGDILVFTEALIHGDTGWKYPHVTPRVQIYYKMTPGWMCWRDPAENKIYDELIQTPLERQLMAPPWTGRYSETESSMGVNNERRPAT